MRVHPGDVRLLDRARERLEPALRPPDFRVGPPEPGVAVDGGDVRDDARALGERDCGNGRAIAQLNRCGERQDGVLRCAANDVTVDGEEEELRERR